MFYLSLLISLLLFWIVCGIGILRAGKTTAFSDYYALAFSAPTSEDVVSTLCVLCA